MKSAATPIRVSLGAHSYDVKIGSGLVERLGTDLKNSPSRKAIVIADERLSEARERVLTSLKKAQWDVLEVPVKAGEELKDLAGLSFLYGALLKARLDRSSTLFALGGGSIGDVAGFVASTYMRGIRWVGIPTTLLGQVDSAIGGKTAVNHPEGKNLIGSFHQPSLVICETSFLKTLSGREILSGMGEIIKYGLVYDAKLFFRIREQWPQFLALDEKVLQTTISQSVRWKAKAVSRDEFDRKGVREVLNFGHTFGHALEKVTHYRSYQHGEAVLWGMKFATALSLARRKISRSTWQEIDSFLGALPLPALPEGLGMEAYLAPMAKDKKAHQGQVRFVLLSALGKSVLDPRVKPEHLHEAFQIMRGEKSPAQRKR